MNTNTASYDDITVTPYAAAYEPAPLSAWALHHVATTAAPASARGTYRRDARPRQSSPLAATVAFLALLGLCLFLATQTLWPSATADLGAAWDAVMTVPAKLEQVQREVSGLVNFGDAMYRNASTATGLDTL